MLPRLAAAVLCVGALSARAQAFADDFESGLDAWELRPNTGITVDVSAAAAHRGDAGLRVNDTETVLADRFLGGATRRFVASDRNFYSRLWFRLTARSTGGGGTLFWSVPWERAPTLWSSAHNFQFDYQSEVHCAEQDVDSELTVYASVDGTGVNALDAGWRLYEAVTLGRGTDAGLNVFAIDGVEVVRKTGLHANTTHFAAVQLGVVFSYDPGFTAVLDFDDIRYGPEPQASRLALSADPARVGTCSRLDVTLASSLPAPDGGAPTGLTAPYPLALAIEGAEPYSDASCTTRAAAPMLTGASLSLWLSPASAGTLSLRVSHTEGDLLPGSATVTVSEAEDGGEASYYALRCAVAPAPALLLAGLALLRRRRRVTSARTS